MRRGWRLNEDLGSGDWRDEDWGRLIGPPKIWTTGTWTQQGVQKTVFIPLIYWYAIDTFIILMNIFETLKVIR